jgi:hypothetical protein
MRLRFVTVLALSLAFASYGSLTLRAQDASVAACAEIDSCMRWMKATVSGGGTRTLDPADFCSGIKRGSTDRRLVWMGRLRMPAGMYDLTPTESPDGWRLAVAKQHGEYLGSVEMKTAASGDPAGRNLVISTKHWAEGCPGPSPDFNVRELHFIYGSTNLFVCLRPDQVPVSHEVNVSQR